jgi:ubiquinone/menaquinone biosynthesis C-methylase UbiE
LNRAEKALMNNPVRAVIQRRYEARLLRHLGGRTNGAHVLEIGCGRGVGTEIAIEEFGAAHVDAFDLDPDMVRLARSRLAPFGERVRLWEGDATAIEAADGTYDAVFDFGIIHHVPDWQAALGEVARVLRPGGRFFFEEVTRHALDRPIYRRLFAHPLQDRFSAAEFAAGLEQAGLRVGHITERFFGDFVLGVAHRERAAA